MKCIVILVCLCFTLNYAIKVKYSGDPSPTTTEKAPTPVADASKTLPTDNSNNYKPMVMSILKEFKLETLYDKATPTEWKDNKSTDIKESIPKLKESFTFLNEQIKASLEHADLQKETHCGSPQGILKIQEYLKANLTGGPKPVEVPTISKATGSAAAKALFMEVTYNVKSEKVNKVKRKRRALMKPFDGILKSLNKLHTNVKTVLKSGLMDRARFTLNYVNYHCKKTKTNEDVQQIINNFTANYYRILDKGVEDFIERIIAMFCDKNKNLTHAISQYECFDTQSDNDKKFECLGKFWVYLVKAIAL